MAAVAAAPSHKVDKNGLVQLSDRTYEELTAVPRDHYTLVLLTATGSQFGCHFCHEFAPQFKAMGASVMKAQKSRSKNDPEIVLGNLDFDKGQNTFKKLQLASAPNLFLYPPTKGPHAKTTDEHLAPEPIRFDFASGSAGDVADRAMEWLSSNTGTQLHIARPFDYAKFVRMITSIVAAIVGLYTFYRVAGTIFYSRHFWAVLTIGAILIFNGGQMFTQIRNMPYSARGGYVAGGFSEQFGAEVLIVAATYGILAFSTISLAVSVPRIKNETTQAMLAAVWIIIQVMVYSFLLQLFRQKNGGYPFKLLL
jgi:oligosaccharyltransferase complex subunit gamma